MGRNRPAGRGLGSRPARVASAAGEARLRGRQCPSRPVVSTASASAAMPTSAAVRVERLRSNRFQPAGWELLLRRAGSSCFGGPAPTRPGGPARLTRAVCLTVVPVSCLPVERENMATRGSISESAASILGRASPSPPPSAARAGPVPDPRASRCPRAGAGSRCPGGRCGRPATGRGRPTPAEAPGGRPALVSFGRSWCATKIHGGGRRSSGAARAQRRNRRPRRARPASAPRAPRPRRRRGPAAERPAPGAGRGAGGGGAQTSLTDSMRLETWGGAKR